MSIDTSVKIQKQISLPFSKAIEISSKNMRTRFFRSLITMSGVILGIAFFMSIRTGDLIIDQLMNFGSEQIKVVLDNLGINEAERTRQAWLVILALLVSVVGISNSMLMAVTERFREIGTMKCLGALDRFILELFLLESGFQGIVGSIIGILVGSVGITIVDMIRFGGEVITNFPWYKFLANACISLLLGFGLAVIGAGYPAYRAAKMKPIDAMRQDV